MYLTFTNVIAFILLHRDYGFQLPTDIGLVGGDGSEWIRLTWQEVFVSVASPVSS